MFGIRIFAALAALSLSLFAQSPDLVISHLYGAGGNSGATLRNDFVVVFNRSGSTVSLAGKSIQYTSATGTGLFSAQPIVSLSGSLAPGQYHLVQLGSGGANGALLPTADTTGTIGMAAGAGKVVLVNSTAGLACNGSSTPCNATQLAQIIDLVGYGSANFFEGAGAAPTLNATTWAVRAGGGCTDTNNNSTDFATATSGTIPNSSTTPAPCGPSLPLLSINDVSLAEGNSGASNMAFTVSLNAPAGPGGVTFDIATADNTATVVDNDYQPASLTAQTIPQGATSYQFTVSINGDLANEPNEAFFVNVTNITGATAADAQGQGTITNDDAPPATCTRTHFISQIQGVGNTSPIAGQTATVDAIVTANKFNGFFVQERDTNTDADPLTSEGIFVFTNNSNGPAVGSNVCVTGTVIEFNTSFGSLTEFASGSTVTTISGGNPLPAPVVLSTTFPAPGGAIDQIERYEGMRVTANSFTAASGTIAASGFDNATFFAVVTGVPRPFREPGIQAPLGVPVGSFKTIPPIPRFDANSELIRIDLRGQNQTTPVPVTAGQTVTNVSGVLDFSSAGYELLQDAGLTPAINGASTFTAVPAPLSNQLTIGHMSLENYNGGATQQAKALRMVRDVLLYPDVIGVSEVTNLTALQNLAAAINAQQAGLNYAAYLGSGTGTQNVGFLAKTARITILGTPGQILDTVTYIDPSDGSNDLLHDRPPYVLKGRAQTPGGGNFDFTAIVVHLRSLIGVDSDATSGATTEGNRVRTKRRLAAENLASYLQSQQLANPTERFIVVGDYNAYEFNDGYVDVLGTLTGNPTPDAQVVQASGDLLTPNFIDLVTTNKIDASERFSYIFGGSRQVLDHVLVSQSFGAFISALRYGRTNTEFPESLGSDTTRPERVSDHDPVLAYVTLPNNPLNDITGVTRVSSTGLVRVNGGYNGFVRLTNLSGQTLTGPLHVLFDTLPAGVTVANAAGTFQGKPYVSTPGPLANGATANISVRYLNPGNVLIQPTYRALQGSF